MDEMIEDSMGHQYVKVDLKNVEKLRDLDRPNEVFFPFKYMKGVQFTRKSWMFVARFGLCFAPLNRNVFTRLVPNLIPE